MAGLSMGGMQTFQITMNNLDTFSYIGGFSGAGAGFAFGGNKLDPKTACNGVLSDPAAFNKRVHLVWLGVGTAEPERMHTGLVSFNDFLQQAGIRHVFYESPGTAHEWQTWRRDLNLLALSILSRRSSLNRRSLRMTRTSVEWETWASHSKSAYRSSIFGHLCGSP